MEASIRSGIKVGLECQAFQRTTSLILTSRADITFNEECPYCGGRLIEKHEEAMVEEGKTIVFVHFRCVKCGKWTKRERL